jgi:hypothetical protein
MDYSGLSFAKASAKELDQITKNVYARVHHRNHLDYSDMILSHSTTILAFDKIGERLGNHPDATINHHDQLIFSVVNRPDDKGEKGGNIVPDIKVGPRFMRIFENGLSPEDIDPIQPVEKGPKNFVPEPWCEESEKDLKAVYEEVYDALLQAPYSVDVVDPSVPYTMNVDFIDEIALMTGQNHDIAIHVGPYLIFSTTEVDGKFLPHIEIGEKFKLQVKNDDATENEEE